MNENILKEKGLVFHGIGTSILRYISIMQNGILSKNAAEKNNISINKNYNGFNRDNYVSVVLPPPIIHNTYKCGAFRMYIVNGISFVIKKSYEIPSKWSSMYSDIIDEAYVKDYIDVSDIVGLMVSSDILNKKLSELPFGLLDMGKFYIDDYCYNTIKTLFERFGYSSSTVELEELIEVKNNIDMYFSNYEMSSSSRTQIIEKMDNFMSNYIQECMDVYFDKKDVTLHEVITRYNYQNLPIYDTNGLIMNNELILDSKKL